MSNDTRFYTKLLLDRMEDGVYDKESLVRLFATYLSESEVEDMMRINDLLFEEDYENDEEE